MERSTAQIFLVARLLIHSASPALATDVSFSHLQTSLPDTSGFNLNQYSLVSTNLQSRPDSLQLKANTPNRENPTSTRDKTPLTGKLSKLKALETLSLPRTPAEVTITEFRPITIKDLEELIATNNPELEAAQRQVNQSKALLLEAISRWYPTINLTANGLPQYLQGEQLNNPEFASDTSSEQWKASASVKIQWNLIDPGRVPEIAAARDNYERSKNTFLIKQRELRLNALTRYFLLQKSNEGVRIGKKSVQASLISLKDAKTRFNAGVATKLEVLEAETQLARDKQLLTGKLGDQSINRRSLAEILNLPPTVTPTIASPTQMVGVWGESLQASIISAYTFREELKKALLDVSLNNNKANSALASSQPTVSIFNTLSGSYAEGQLAVSDPSMRNYGSTISNTVGLNATWSIFDGGRSKSLYKYNKQKAKEAEANFQSERSLIRKQVEESYYKMITAKQDILTTTQAVIASKESLRLARLRFKAGITTQREVVNNQRDLTEAEVRYTDAINSYNTSIVELRRRTGIDKIQPCSGKSYADSRLGSKKSNDIPRETVALTDLCQPPLTNQ